MAGLAEIEREEEEEEEEEEAWNEIHLFHIQHYFYCHPLELETKLNKFKLMNDCTDQKFKKELLVSSRRTLTEMYGRKMKESVDKFGKNSIDCIKINQIKYAVIMQSFICIAVFVIVKPILRNGIKRMKKTMENFVVYIQNLLFFIV